jgi:hypothetical protein
MERQTYHAWNEVEQILKKGKNKRNGMHMNEIK